MQLREVAAGEGVAVTGPGWVEEGEQTYRCFWAGSVERETVKLILRRIAASSS